MAALPEPVAAALKAVASPGAAEPDVRENLRALHGFLDHWDRARRTQLASAGGVGAVVAAAKANEGSEEVQLLAVVRPLYQCTLPPRTALGHAACALCPQSHDGRVQRRQTRRP